MFGSDFRALLTWWKLSFRNGRSRANDGLPLNFRYGECMSGLSLTLDVMLITSLAYLHPEGLRRRHLRVTKQAGGPQAGRHSKLERHGYPMLNHTVLLGRIDRRVLAADPTFVKQRHEFRLGEFGAVVRANAVHNGRDNPGVDVGQKTSKRPSGRRTSV